MNSSPLDRVSLKNPVHLLALGFGSGLIRPAPGTWGSLAGTILGSALLACLGLKIFLILTALCFAFGCYLCQKRLMIWAFMITVPLFGMNLLGYLLC